MPVSPWNATQTSLVSSIDAGPLLMIVMLLAGVLLLIIVLTSLERYTKLLEAFSKLVASLKYTAFGFGITAAGYALYISCNFIASVGKGIDPIWIAEAVGVYIVLTALGWGGSKVVGRVRNMHAAYVESKKVAL
jgi:hypothetical protein